MTSARRAASKYDELAGAYDTRWAFYVATSVARTLGCVAPREGDLLLDVGCGTGQLLRAAQERWPALRCVGVDPSRKMLLKGRPEPDATSRPAPTMIQAAGEFLPVRDASVNWVVSTSVLHYLDDPRLALREWRRVLKPGGTLVITDWCRDYATIRAYSAWQRLSSSIPPHVHAAAELRALLADCAFEPGDIDRYRINWFWGLMTAVARTPSGL